MTDTQRTAIFQQKLRDILAGKAKYTGPKHTDSFWEEVAEELTFRKAFGKLNKETK